MLVKPIIFSAEMVRATLEGRKTQMRGAVDGIVENPGPYTKEGWERGEFPKCPYGYVGDQWDVCESWGYLGASTKGTEHKAKVIYHADGLKTYISFPTFKELCAVTPKQNIKYPDDFDEWDELAQSNYQSAKLNAWWKRQRRIPAYRMRPWASRIRLEVVNIRVERLQELIDTDALAEGIPWAGRMFDRSGITRGRISEDFIKAWDIIHKKKDGVLWTDNPWVWVVDFKVVETG